MRFVGLGEYHTSFIRIDDDDDFFLKKNFVSLCVFTLFCELNGYCS